MKKKKTPGKPKFKLRKFLLKAILIVLAALALVLLVTMAQVYWLKDHNPGSTAWMRLRKAQAEDLGKKFELKYTWVPMKQLPRHISRAVIAAEDGDFYKHHGFDWNAIKKAYAQNEKTGKIKRGGSTITQQLAKNLYLSPSRSYLRKVREGVITYFLERFLSKERILELYLNCIEFGPGVFGIEEAARHHFGISASKLSLDQACKLAAIIPSPLRYRVTGPYVIKRAGRIRRAVGP